MRGFFEGHDALIDVLLDIVHLRRNGMLGKYDELSFRVKSVRREYLLTRRIRNMPDGVQARTSDEKHVLRVFTEREDAPPALSGRHEMHVSELRRRMA